MSDYIAIPLSKTGKRKNRYTALISEEDFELSLFNWTVVEKKNGNAYAIRTLYIDGKRAGHQSLHRAIMAAMEGRELLPEEQVDHIDGDGLNNQRWNLRLADNQKNQWNTRVSSRNKSGLKGVSKVKNRWRARIKGEYGTIHLGTFPTKEEAHEAYCKAADEMRKDYANHG